MNKFTITEEERKRILGMHVEATKRHYGLVSEQYNEKPFTNDAGVTYKYQAITDENTLEKFVNFHLATPNMYTVSDYANLKKQGLGSSQDYSSYKEVTRDSPISGLLSTYKGGLYKIAELGRLLRTSDITSELREPLRRGKVTMSDDELVKNINTLAKNAQKSLFPNNPLS